MATGRTSVTAESFSGKGPYLKRIRYHGKGFFGIMDKVKCHYFVKLVEGPPPPPEPPKTGFDQAKDSGCNKIQGYKAVRSGMEKCEFNQRKRSYCRIHSRRKVPELEDLSPETKGEENRNRTAVLPP
ncbi:39S ribosomal protein L22, mitochondrial [Varanus komodoensis]|nr:39S ribosomal protein L22, mitochondrial [Varanus komodoensis]